MTHPHFLWLQRKAEHEVCLLAAGVGGDLGEKGYREGVGHTDVLGGP